jgi:hypothetical protein
MREQLLALIGIGVFTMPAVLAGAGTSSLLNAATRRSEEDEMNLNERSAPA